MNRLFILLVVLSSTAVAQNTLPPPVTFTTAEDHKHMMEQLGITALRPGYNPNGPNSPNYDPAKANPWPELPDVLTLNNGKKVKTPEAWWKNRRPEIIEDFEREVYGRVPDNVPDVRWEVQIQEREFMGRRPVIARKLVGRVDNSAYPHIEVNLSMTLVTPADAKGPVPVLIMFGPSTLPAPVQPNRDDFEKLNAAVRELLSRDPEIKAILDRDRAYCPLVGPEGCTSFGFAPSGEVSRQQGLINAGWGYAMLHAASIQADNGAGLTRGIIGLVNKGLPRQPEDWGSLRAWAWGAARALDLFEQDPGIDATRVGIEGVSRYGKAALVTMAFEPRFALGLIGSAGEGGVSPYRRNFGEMVENITGSGEYHWMAGNFLKYGTEESRFGRMDANDLPVDSHALIAL